MGTYLNPGNAGFKRIIESEYIDKTGLIRLINSTIGTTRNLTCISRPRRFGKSYAAQMLCAYYDRTCDSHALFEGLHISADPSYEKYLNQYNVIYLDMTQILGEADKQTFIGFLKGKITEELKAAYPELVVDSALTTTLIRAVELTGNQFVMLIDEWDAPIRENQGMEKAYLEFLRTLFKSSGTTSRIFAAAYMTGILPIKKDGSQSAISDFKEYSMLDPQEFAEYVGFTEKEVQNECEKLGRSFESMKKWYDGYTVGDCRSIYNPYSVMQALGTGKYKSYWKKTSAAETLLTYIDMDQDGLQEDVARLIAGESIIVNTDSFQNDVETFTCKDDVLTLLIHLGYLTYEEISDSYDESADEELTGIATIPNEEVRSEFRSILRKGKHHGLIELVRRSDELLRATLAGDQDMVARTIQEVHDSGYAPSFYNNEQSLRYVIKMAYLTCVDQYAKVEELPTGHGIADVVYLPKRSSPLPAMIVELKWNKSADGAINQILECNYPQVLESYDQEVILVGISYDKKTKKHECRIQKGRGA